MDVLNYEGQQDGPTFVVLGGVHGDEPGGSRAIRHIENLLNSGQMELIVGELILIPEVNREALKKGVHLAGSKLTAKKRIVKANLPKKVIVPLQQNIGVGCDSLVKVGDYVKKYQKIGESNSLISAPIHSPISGMVTDISSYTHAVSKKINSIVIESDGKDTDYKNKTDYTKLSPEELIDKIHQAGIVGMGGAAFPTHIKLRPKTQISTLIINGAECEPYLTTDHRLMIEYPGQIIKGIRILMKAIGIDSAFIAIEDNKIDAIQEMEKHANEKIQISRLKTKYPHGAEKIVIKFFIKKNSLT
jgi:electron transport complex protein RnfC